MLATINLVTKPFSWIVVGSTIVMSITVLYNLLIIVYCYTVILWELKGNCLVIQSLPEPIYNL